MHQHLEIPRLLPLIPNHNARRQRIPTQRNTVYQPKLKGPRFSALLAEVAGTETKVELDAVVAAGYRG